MIIQEYSKLDTSDRTRIYVDVTCDICNNVFTRQKRQLKAHTCSISCSNVLKGSALILKCDHCHINFTMAKSKLKNSKSGKRFCSRICKDIAQTYMPEIRPAHYGDASYREKAFRHYLPRCNSCGFSVVAALEVHHKDRNRDNNTLENLEILCANCHSIEHLG